MPIIEKTGNLLKSKADILVDLNNCMGVSGAGLAKAFKEEIPDHFWIYQDLCLKENPSPGDARVILYKNKTGSDEFQTPFTVSLFTKGHWRDDTKVSWVDSCLQGLREIILETNDEIQNRFPRRKRLPSVALAHPGGGLGGLSKETIRPLIEKYLGDLPNEIFLY